MVTNLEKVEEIAEEIRQEPYVFLNYNCIWKAIEFKRRCLIIGIPARVVVCIALAKARWFGSWLTIPIIHGWGEVEGRRLEVSRPLGASGPWGIVSVNIKPVIAIWI